MAAAGAMLAGLFVYQFVFRYPFWTLHAFVVPSGSFCPTICRGERIVAQMQWGNPYVPKRGDVILFQHGPNQTNYIKRVIGIPGDVVGPGPRNTILVNGQPWQPPAACAKSLCQPKDTSFIPFPPFHNATVAPNQIFVVGDNLEDSFDSRMEELGLSLRTRSSAAR
jgi:signal peptidase I